VPEELKDFARGLLHGGLALTLFGAMWFSIPADGKIPR